MKLYDYEDYFHSPVPGFCLNILKFKKRAVFMIALDKMTDNWPSLMIHMGQTSPFEFSVGLPFIKYYVSFNLWSKHYD